MKVKKLHFLLYGENTKPRAIPMYTPAIIWLTVTLASERGSSKAWFCVLGIRLGCGRICFSESETLCLVASEETEAVSNFSSRHSSCEETM